MDTVLQIVGFACVAYFVWYILQPKATFIIRIGPDGPKLREGKAPGWFLAEVAEVCHDAGIKAGTIKAIPQQKRITLQFSRHFPPGLQQRMRNIWNMPR